MSKVNPYEYLNVPSGWTCKRLEECTQDRNISYGIVQPGQHTESGVPVIRVNNVNNGQLELKDVLKVSHEIEKKYERTRLKGGEILLTLVGSTGQSFVAPKELAGWNVPRAIAVIRVDESIGANWINICLQTEEVKHFLNVRANTTVQKTLNLKDVRDIPILIPPKDVKTSIENIALGLSQKIRLNTQTNQTLESIAQAIFKSWFVDFEPVKAKMAAKERWYAMQPTSESASPVCYANDAALPDLETHTNLAAMCAISGKSETELAQLQQQNPDQYQQLGETAALFPSAMVDSELGEIPKGWDIFSLNDVANLNEKSWTAKNAPSEIHYVDLANTKWGVINSVEIYNYSIAPSRARRVLRRNDTIIGTVRPSNGSYAFVKASNLTGSTGFAVLSPKQKIFAELIYIAATTPENIERLAHLADGGAYPAVRPEVVMETPIVLPEKKASLEDICLSFSQSTASMFEKSFNNQEENASLAQLRDSLLPKLLSGEIDLTKIENEVI